MRASQFLRNLRTLSVAELVSIHGVGEKLAENIVSFAASPRHEALAKNFEDLETSGQGLTITARTRSSRLSAGALSGEVIVITGSFAVPRGDIKTQLEDAGAKVSGSVSKTTTILLAGEKSGSKLNKAEKLGVRVVHDYESLLNPKK